MASIILSQSSGVPGTSVHIIAEGFMPNSKINFYFDEGRVGGVMTNASGNVDEGGGGFMVPWYEARDYTFNAVGNVTASAPFTIEPYEMPDPVIPDPVIPEESNTVLWVVGIASALLVVAGIVMAVRK
jgi:hypothetical protein